MNTQLQISEELSELIETFTEKALANGWDTFTGSSGKCWFIANEFAVDAREKGLQVEIWRVKNIHSTRPADDVSNFIFADGLAIDFASHGGEDSAHLPWPRVCSIEDYLLAHGGERVQICPSCGTSEVSHSVDVCPGAVSHEIHRELAKENLEKSLQTSGLLSLLVGGSK